MRPLRVLHGPVEVAGVAGAIVRGLRLRGHDAELVVMVPPPFGMSYDRLVSGYPRRTREGLLAPLRHDVLHFHFNVTFCEYFDAAWAHLAGRPLMLMHFHGDDCRRREVTMALHPARARIYDATERNERLTLRRLRAAGRLCAAGIVADLELLEHVRPFFRAVYVVPAPVEIQDPPQVLPPLPGEGPVVFHAPSQAIVKGTQTIADAIGLVASRRPLRPRLVSGVTHAELLSELARADIVIDQMNSETPGIFALEAMALGKPTLCEYRREMLAPFAATTPLVQAPPDILADVLEDLCDDEARRASLGVRGAAFVREVHDAKLVARAVERVYEHAGTRPTGVFEATHEGVRELTRSPS